MIVLLVLFTSLMFDEAIVKLIVILDSTLILKTLEKIFLLVLNKNMKILQDK